VSSVWNYAYGKGKRYTEDQILCVLKEIDNGSSVAAASLLCQLAGGKDVKWVNALRAQDLLVILGGLPEGKEKFASMAVSALQNAVSSKLIMEKG